MRVSFVLRSAEESSETSMHIGGVKNRNVISPLERGGILAVTGQIIGMCPCQKSECSCKTPRIKNVRACECKNRNVIKMSQESECQAKIGMSVKMVKNRNVSRNGQKSECR